MSDRTDKQMKPCTLAIWIVAAVVGGMQVGCASDWRSQSPTTRPGSASLENKSGESAGESRKFQPPREIAPEDVEAFQNAVDQISRLEYGPAESEIRLLLVRFESVDDPKYVSEALFWLGYCCEKQGVFDQARDYYQRLVEHYTNTRPGKQAKQRLKLLPPE